VNSSLWDLCQPGWTAEIELEVEDLCVRWQAPAAEPVQRQFPYGFSRADVEAAILAGP
jgi:hypothetical protein